MQRVWTVERQVDPEGYDLGINPDELDQAAIDAARIVSRIGGVVYMGPEREEVAPEVFATTRVVFRWDSFAPARRQRRSGPKRESPQPVAETEGHDEAQELGEQPVEELALEG